MSRPTITVEVAFTTTNPLTIPGSWTDISSYVLEDGLAIRRGRADELKQFSAGTATIRLNNRDRRFEPINTDGAYSPNVVPMRRIRIRATWASTSYTLFYGFVTAWTPEYDSDAPVVAATCIDFIGAYLARTSFSTVKFFNDVWPGDGTSAVEIEPSAAFTMNGRAMRITAYHDGTYTGLDNRAFSITGINADTAIEETEFLNVITDDENDSSLPSVVVSVTRWTSVTAISFERASEPMTGAGMWLTIEPDLTYPEALSSDAINTILTGLNIASGDRAINTGTVSVGPITYGTSTINGLAQRIATSEAGMFYVSRDGLITFRNGTVRKDTSTPSTVFDTTTTLPYARAVVSYDDQNIYNIVRVSRDGGNTQEERDETSIGKYFARDLNVSTVLANDNEALALAQTLLPRYATPNLRIKSLRLDGELAPATLWPVILSADLNSRYRVILRQRTGDIITQNVWLEGINTSIRGGKWDIEWMLSPSGPAFYGTLVFWELGTSALGTTTILA